MSWEQKQIGEYIEVLSGFAFKANDFIDAGVPVIKIKNICPPYVSLDGVTYVSDDMAKKQSKYALNYNDVLIAMTGSHINQWASVVGRVARVKYDIKTLLNQRVGKIVIKENGQADIDYIYFYLSQNDVTRSLALRSGGAANQANISPADIKGLNFPCPPLPIQRKIAGILSAYDDLIENNRRQIKLLEEAARRLYKEWFVDLRFPGHEQTEMVDGLPAGWERKKLGEIAEFKRGKTITRDNIIEGSVPVVAGGIEPAYYHSKANTVAPVITISGSGANAGFTKIYFEDVFASDCSFADSMATDYLSYVYLFLKSNTSVIDNMQKGAAQPHVYPKDINGMDCVLPQEKVLDDFCYKADHLFAKIKNLYRQNQLLQEARDRLLPKLMNGEIEVTPQSALEVPGG